MTTIKYKVGNSFFLTYKDAVDAKNATAERIEVLYEEGSDVCSYSELIGRINHEI